MLTQSEPNSHITETVMWRAWSVPLLCMLKIVTCTWQLNVASILYYHPTLTTTHTCTCRWSWQPTGLIPWILPSSVQGDWTGRLSFPCQIEDKNGSFSPPSPPRWTFLKRWISRTVSFHFSLQLLHYSLWTGNSTHLPLQCIPQRYTRTEPHRVTQSAHMPASAVNERQLTSRASCNALYRCDRPYRCTYKKKNEH